MSDPAAYLESADGQRWPVASYDQKEDCDIRGRTISNFRMTFTLRMESRPVPQISKAQLYRLIFPRNGFEIRTSLLAVEDVIARADLKPICLEVRVTLHDADRVDYVSTGTATPEREQAIDLSEFARLLEGGTPMAPVSFTTEGGLGKKRKRKA